MTERHGKGEEDHDQEQARHEPEQLPDDVDGPVRVDVLWGAWSLARPVLIAASVVIVAAGVMVARTASRGARGPVTVAESLGVPPGFSVGATGVTAPPAGGQAR